MIDKYFAYNKTDSNDRIVKLVKGLNEGPNTAEWNVLICTGKGMTIHLSLSIDLNLAEQLKEFEYQINYNFRQITITQKLQSLVLNIPKFQCTPKNCNRSLSIHRSQHNVAKQLHQKGKRYHLSLAKLQSPIKENIFLSEIEQKRTINNMNVLHVNVHHCKVAFDALTKALTWTFLWTLKKPHKEESQNMEEISRASVTRNAW